MAVLLTVGDFLDIQSSGNLVVFDFVAWAERPWLSLSDRVADSVRAILAIAGKIRDPKGRQASKSAC